MRGLARQLGGLGGLGGKGLMEEAAGTAELEQSETRAVKGSDLAAAAGGCWR